jgi:hypothetical protein
VKESLRKSFLLLLLSGWGLCGFPAAADAEEVRFDSAPEWRRWNLPLGAVAVGQDGTVRPVKVRKNINAMIDATQFGGGIGGAGSNSSDAALVMDGDPTTGWSPDPGDAPQSWWLELDLGRAVSAHRVELVFDEGAPPFAIFDLLVSTGEPMLNNALVPVPGTLVYRLKERFAQNQKHRVRLALERPEQSLVKNVRVQVFRAPPGARLVEVEVIAFGDNLAPGYLERGGNLDIVIEVADPRQVTTGKTLSAADGLVTTAWWPSGAARNAEDTFAHITLDLGATYWVDLVRLISRLGWAFAFKFYEVQTSDGSLAPDGSLVWHKQFSGFGSETNRRQGLADHVFAPTPARYMRIFWKYWDANCPVVGYAIYEACFAWGITEELQVFGQGYPRQARLRSPILDLGGQKNINAIRWQAQTSPGTQMEVRSRTGNVLDIRTTFHDKNGKEVTEKKWENLIPSFRGPIDTAFVVGTDWSPWSRAYGLSGEDFQSPSPRRYLELEARLVSESPELAASLDWLSVEFSEPLAEGVVGEIFPVEVAPGIEHEFSYFVKAPLTSGFDRLALEASTPLRFIEARIGEQRSEVEVEENGEGFRVIFPRAVRQGELVELRFAASVFVQGTRFQAFLEDGQGVRQRVEAGDASEQAESSTQVVRLPVGQGLLANLSISPRVLTPNGDGVNDALQVKLDLVNVLESRPMYLRIFDLAGRGVHQVERQVMAGAQELAWDGRDGSGALVPPGAYMVRLEVEGDAQSASVSRVVGVVY